ncbi:MAG: tetratricopeptide repeat protein [Candidatus Omnitrophica bacterium]|nr:tetratricopeptide repeat protein [Candidatus Omnitrophota bacterium]
MESVAWISERKDVLYACFFLAALICYCYYLRKEKIGKYYYSSLILFIFSLLSKAMAITLPAVLLLIDYFLHRKRSKTALLDKIPFFILSFIFGIIAAIGQYSSGAVRQESLLNFVNKIAVSSYGIIFYLNKILVPIKLSCFYPYAGTKEISLFPYTFITVVILLAAVIISSKRTRKIIFGSFLFLITILPVLQFIPIGNIIVADRYIYISSLGIFYLISEGFIWLCALKTKHLYFLQSLMMLIILTGALGILATLTWKRCQVWNNSIVLWSDVLKNYPNEATAYKNRGVAYRDQGNFTQAISDYNRAIELNPNDADPYNNRGVVYRDQGNFTQAISDYNRAIELKPNYADAYYNRALAYQAQGSPAQAISNFSKAIKIDSHLVKAYNNRATAYVQEKNYELALSDLNKAIEITPNDGEVFYNRAVVRFLMKEYDKAWMDIHRAEELGEKVDPKLIELLRKASKNKELPL